MPQPLPLRAQVITDTLDLHGFRSHVDVRGCVWAEEIATVPHDGGHVDATAWVLVPTHLTELKFWLGY